jgi:hypothetical protein
MIPNHNWVVWGLGVVDGAGRKGGTGVCRDDGVGQAVARAPRYL